MSPPRHLFSFEPPAGGAPAVRLLEGDALDAARALGADATVDLAYLDPPFASGYAYHSETRIPGRGPAVVLRRPAFSDPCRDDPDAYLASFAPRLDAVCRLLRPGGGLYVHLDWRVAAHVRVHLDRTLGHAALRNEIVWRRNPPLGRKARAGQFGRVTDTILYYVAPGGPATFHPQTVTRLAEPGTYRLDSATGRAFRTAPRGDYTDASIRRLAAEGRIHVTRSGTVRIRYDLEPAEGAPGRWLERMPVDSLWLDVPDAMHVPPAERTGYPTQKPERLLERIVLASSNPGDLVLDPYCGSGTTLAVAARLGREAVGADVSPLAVHAAFLRLARAGIPVHVERLVAEGPLEPAAAAGDLRALAGAGGDVRLISYAPGRVPPWNGAAAAVEAARASSGLALLEGWGIDPDTCDGPPRLRRWLAREPDGSVPLSAGCPEPRNGRPPRILALDVFGNRVVGQIDG